MREGGENGYREGRESRGEGWQGDDRAMVPPGLLATLSPIVWRDVGLLEMLCFTCFVMMAAASLALSN